MNNQRGFTLIELLIVIAIIVVLAAILFPVMSRARESGQRATAITQARQLGLALMMYAESADNKYLPSTNYGLPESSRNRMWPSGLLPFAKDKKIFVAPGSEGAFPETWEERGMMTIGYNSSTAIDKIAGCSETQEQKQGCLAFSKAASFDENDEKAKVALFAFTPGGPTDQRYRGYEFSPYNGIENPENPSLTPPLTSDRDLVKELEEIDAELIKPIYARYGRTGNDDGSTPIIFADGHTKSYTAHQINSFADATVWRFR